MGKLVGTTQDEKGLSYYKFYENGLPEIPEFKLRLAENAQPADRGIPFDRKDDFILMPSDKGYCYQGFGENPDGTAYAANQTFVPNGKPEMLEWFFTWMGLGPDLRFRIWDPEDHYFSKMTPLDRAFDASIPVRERLWGCTFYVLEDIGLGHSMDVALKFLNPVDFGYSRDLLWTEDCPAVISSGAAPACVSHKCRMVEGGMYIDSYFWVGYYVNKEGHPARIPSSVNIPIPLIKIAKCLYSHSLCEMTKLASVLAPLYKEEGGKI